MALTVFHIGDQILGYQRFSRIVIREHLLKGFYDDFNNLYVLFFIMSAHIIGFEKPALFLYHVDGLGMILHIQPVTYVFAVAIYGKLLSV